jgi:glucose-1-phosphate adenylyltransferase
MPQSNLVSMGIYIFNTKILIKYLAEDNAQQDSPHDFGYAVMPRIVKNSRVFAYKYNHYWQDIGTIEAYYAANLELTRENPAFSLDGIRPVITAGYNSLLTKTSHQGNVRDSIIGPGCVIRGQVINSILSAGVRVEEESVISNSVLMANTTIGYHSTIDGCILDERVQVGKYCYLGFGSDLTSEDQDITVVGTRATIPDRIAIGHGSRILPFVENSDFNTNIVRSGASVSPQPEPPTKEKIII